MSKYKRMRSLTHLTWSTQSEILDSELGQSATEGMHETKRLRMIIYIIK
jgi:hypothetical protein